MKTSASGTFSNSFSIGDGSSVDGYIYFNNGQVNKPCIKYNSSTSKIQYSDNGTTWNNIVPSYHYSYSGTIQPNQILDAIKIPIPTQTFMSIKAMAVCGSNTGFASYYIMGDGYRLTGNVIQASPISNIITARTAGDYGTINIDGYENTNLAVIITGHASATTTWKIEADALSVPTNYSA